MLFYDPLGRQTTIPGAGIPATGIPATDTPAAADTSGGNTGGSVGDIHLAYYDTDAAKTITQAGVTTSYTLDPAGRRSLETTVTASDDDPVTTRVQRHYTDGSDNPAYVTTTDTDGATTNTWYATSINGDLGSTITTDTHVQSLIDPLGSVATTITLGHDDNNNPTLTLGPVGTWDEYGNPLTTPTDNDNPTTTTTNQPTAGTAGGPIGYGWLGGKQRPTTTPGLLLMGARLYNPVTGQFTTTDPIPGGNTTTYTYPQDPINQTDLDGQWKIKKWFKKSWSEIRKGAKWLTDSKIGKIILGACSLAWGYVAGACAAVYTAAYGVQGRWKEAGVEVASFAAGWAGSATIVKAGAKLSRPWSRAVAKKGVEVTRKVTMRKYDLAIRRYVRAMGWSISARTAHELGR